MGRHVIDANGWFLHDVAPGYTVVPGTTETDIERPVGVLMHRPRLVNGAWVDGEQPAVIEQRGREAHATQERAWRNVQLDRADKAVNDATDRGDLPRAQLWAAYRIALRDMPEQDANPFNWIRPEAPQ